MISYQVTATPIDSNMRSWLTSKPQAQRQLLHVVALADIADEDLARDQKPIAMWHLKALKLRYISLKDGLLGIWEIGGMRM